jgi:AcrR family transcriptional regulator
MADETRDRIIAATNELFRRHGYNGTGLAAIGRLAKATTGSIYHFFPGGKSELARAVVIETGAAYGELFALISLEDADNPAEGVRAFFSGAADILEQDDYIDPCPIGTIAREVASTDDELRRATNLVFSSWADLLARQIAGTDTPGPKAMETATAVVGMLEGGFIISRARRDSQILRAMGDQAADLVAMNTARDEGLALARSDDQR